MEQHRKDLAMVLQLLQCSPQFHLNKHTEREREALDLDEGYAIRRFLHSAPPSPSLQVSTLSDCIETLDLATTSDQLSFYTAATGTANHWGPSANQSEDIKSTLSGEDGWTGESDTASGNMSFMTVTSKPSSHQDNSRDFLAETIAHEVATAESKASGGGDAVSQSTSEGDAERRVLMSGGAPLRLSTRSIFPTRDRLWEYHGPSGPSWFRYVKYCATAAYDDSPIALLRDDDCYMGLFLALRGRSYETSHPVILLSCANRQLSKWVVRYVKRLAKANGVEIPDLLMVDVPLPVPI